jgi:hypothetical protein
MLRPPQGPDHDNPGQMINRYRINPYRMTRTVVNHFPSFTARLRNAGNTTVRAAFDHIFDNLHAV